MMIATLLDPMILDAEQILYAKKACLKHLVDCDSDEDKTNDAGSTVSLCPTVVLILMQVTLIDMFIRYYRRRP